jgi:aryl-alcohol dehydrogenase-like predicted oxidoreductase
VIQSGINWIDTAPMDGLSHAEEVIDKALHDIPEADRPHRFTKCGLQMRRERELQSTAIQEI